MMWVCLDLKWVSGLAQVAKDKDEEFPGSISCNEEKKKKKKTLLQKYTTE